MALITVTGTLLNIFGVPIQGFVEFLLVNYDGNLPVVSGTNIVVPLAVDANCISNGSFSQQLQGNDTITPSNTIYQVTFKAADGSIFYIADYVFVGSGPVNLNSYPPINPVNPIGPASSILLAGNNTWTGLNTFLQPTGFNRIVFNQGTKLAASDFVLSGWGAGASISSVVGTDSCCQITVVAGTGAVIDPIITLTYHDGAWPSIPIVFIQMTNGTGLISDLTITPGTTSTFFIYSGLPITGQTYVFSMLSIGG